MEVSRSYTPVPPCLHPDDIAPNYKSDCLCLMIKRYPQGALSPSITALQIGQTFLLSNALGAFVIESFDRYSVIHMLAGGTGLTAMLGIIQRALARCSVSVSPSNHYSIFIESVIQGGPDKNGYLACHFFKCIYRKV